MGLVRKRAEIAGQIEHTQDQLRQLVIDLGHIDASIHIFDPSIELEEIKARPVPPKHHAFRGPGDPDRAHDPAECREFAHGGGHCPESDRRARLGHGANVRLLKAMTKRAGACLRNL